MSFIVICRAVVEVRRYILRNCAQIYDYIKDSDSITAAAKPILFSLNI